MAAQGYAAALAAAPDNALLAGQALSQAINAGDRVRALAAAQVIGRSGTITPDARLMLLTEALRRRDWAQAGVQIDGMAQDRTFSFMAPILRAWVASGSGQGDPLVLIEEASKNQFSAGYAAEQRVLLLLALRRPEGVTELLAHQEAAGGRIMRLRVAAAAGFARRGDRREALELLQGEGAALAAARRLVETRKRIPGEITTPQAGIAEFLVTIAGDLRGQNLFAPALTFARIATFLAPENSMTWMVTSDILGAQGRHTAALELLANVRADDPFAEVARDTRVQLMAGAGQKDAALAEALALANAPGAGAREWTRVGDLYGELERRSEAADAYGRALALGGEAESQPPAWALWLLRGSALDQAGDWAGAKAALTEAHRLAPEQPFVLNYLGYAQLERRENVEEAERMVREASRLAPDNAAITDSLGWAHYVRGDFPGAIALLERAAEGEPADPEINEHLGDAYYSAGRRVAARYAWKAAMVYAEGEDAERLRAKIETGLTPQLAAR